MTKIEYYENEYGENNTRESGWYINDYHDIGKAPYHSVGPFETKTAALRHWRDTEPNKISHSVSKEPSDAGHKA